MKLEVTIIQLNRNEEKNIDYRREDGLWQSDSAGVAILGALTSRQPTHGQAR